MTQRYKFKRALALVLSLALVCSLGAALAQEETADEEQGLFGKIWQSVQMAGILVKREAEKIATEGDWWRLDQKLQWDIVVATFMGEEEPQAAPASAPAAQGQPQEDEEQGVLDSIRKTVRRAGQALGGGLQIIAGAAGEAWDRVSNIISPTPWDPRDPDWGN